MPKRVKYIPSIPIQFLELLVTKGEYPERKEIGTDKDWLVKLSWLVGECYYKGYYRKGGEGGYRYEIPKVNVIRQLFPRSRPYIIDGDKKKKVEKLYKYRNEMVDAPTKIMSLAFHQGTKGNNLRKTNTEYFIKEEIKELFTYVSYANLPRPKEPRNTLPYSVKRKVGLDIPPTIQVNTDSVLRCIQEIDLFLFDYRKNKNTISVGDFLSDGLNSSIKSKSKQVLLEKIEWYRNRLEYIRLLSSNPNGYRFYQKYQQIKTGRLNFITHNLNNQNLSRINFQTLEKPIRNIVFGGLGYYDCDVKNCHPTILKQYYKMVVGKTNKWLESYAANTGPTRDKINKDLGLHYGLGKELLLGIIYSAGSNIPSSVKSLEQQLRKKQNKTFGELIPKYYPNKDEALEVGVRIVESEYIQDIVGNIKGISRDINDKGGFGIVEDGYITNVVGVRNHDISKTSQKMANLLQSIETDILYSVIRLFGYNIVCLYHDGFIVNKNIEQNKDLLVDRVLSSSKLSLDRWFKKNKIVPYSLSGIEVDYSMKIIPEKKKIYERKTETTIYG